VSVSSNSINTALFEISTFRIQAQSIVMKSTCSPNELPIGRT